MENPQDLKDVKAAPAAGPTETASAETAATSLTSNEETQKKIADLEAQVKEKESKYLYLYADFENARKRAIKERSDLLKFGWENVARDLLLVLDNFDRAMTFIPAGTDENFVSGLKMMAAQFHQSLQKQGVEKMNTIGQPFDPNLHEGMGQEPSTDVAEGLITKEHLPGYTLHGRLLRPARVVVSTGVNSGTEKTGS